MKLISISHKNVDKLLSYSNKSPLIVKYYSPTCGACLNMQGEWDNMCNDLEKNYHGEIVVASVDPSGRDALDKYNIYSEINGYPTILYLVNGEKKDEYNGDRSHKDMIKWMKSHDLISKKRKGGRKSLKKKRKSKKNKKKILI